MTGLSALAHATGRAASGLDLTEVEAHDAVSEVMEGSASDAILAAFLTALRLKGETPDELAGAVRAVRGRMTAVDVRRFPLLDTCGTGGDGLNTVNISTAAAIVVAASGVAVAKHGNRSASGNSGSAEVLAELGIAIEPTPTALRRGLDELGLAYLHAPRHHPALRHAACVRKALPFRTLLNLVGPLANPANPSFQVIGVPGARQAELVAAALVRLGTTNRAAVVRGEDGLDEVTLAGPTHVLMIEAGEVRSETWTPSDFGLPTAPVTDLRISGPAESATRIVAFLDGEPGPVRSAILANAAAALVVAGVVASLREGVGQTAEAVDSGRARDLLRRWRAISPSA